MTDMYNPRKADFRGMIPKPIYVDKVMLSKFISKMFEQFPGDPKGND